MSDAVVVEITDLEIEGLSFTTGARTTETLRKRAYWTRLWIGIEKDKPKLNQRDLSKRVWEDEAVNLIV